MEEAARMRAPGLLLLPLTMCLVGGLASVPSAAHPGGLDPKGCHNNRRTGGYHCHRGSASTPSFVEHGRSKFASCSQARAAGAAPVRRGQAGYGGHLDRDGDGVGCE